MRATEALSGPARASLAEKRIFFGHQSVGENILAGLSDLAREDPTLPLRLVTLDEAGLQPGGFFSHAHLGSNGDPAGKTNDFARLLDERLAGRLDVAFHKYCFVDVTASADVRSLFQHYESVMGRLRANHPGVTFVHVTVPLMRVQSGPKAIVKKAIGRAPAGYADNFRREEFNALIRGKYAGREPVFDLAAIESMTMDGRPVEISFGGVRGRGLLEPYTADGGHLNALGRRLVAHHLVAFLAALAPSGR